MDHADYNRQKSPSARAAPEPARRRRDPRHALGTHGEDLAVAHLQRLGFAVIERNVRTRHGEIDLIAFDGQALVFVEVKTRRCPAQAMRIQTDSPTPLEGLRPRQRARLRRLAAAWLRESDSSRPTAREIRFDAIGVLLDPRGELLRLDHVEGAW